MIEFTQLQKVLSEQRVEEGDQKIVREFLLSFGFEKRQQLMAIFLGFPEKVELFVDILKKKVDFVKNPSEAQAKEILAIEHEEIKNLTKELI